MSVTPSNDSIVVAEAKPYHYYYDLLHSKKDYAGEVDVILAIYRRHCGTRLTKVLDVGCGTGNHSIELARRGYAVLGVDIDEHMIAVARDKQSKASRGMVRFVQGDAAQVSESSFELAISMFNVVNYIEDCRELVRFFEAIRKRLVDGGLCVFDCINGVAAMIDAPRKKESRIEGKDAEVLEVNLNPSIDLWDDMVYFDGRVEVSKPGTVDSFRYSFRHRLWTPRCLRDTLETTGYEITKVCRWMKPEAPAPHLAWKIMFVCKKK